MKKTIFCVIALGMSVATVYGQDEVTAINTGAANFLTIMPDARTAALAGAGVSLTGNENAIFLNGATIAADKNCRGGASYTYAPWMRDYQSGYSLHTLGGFYKIDEKNVILAGFRYYNYPKLGVLETGGESIRPKELAAEVGYARELIKNLSVSATFRYAPEHRLERQLLAASCANRLHRAALPVGCRHGIRTRVRRALRHRLFHRHFLRP